MGQWRLAACNAPDFVDRGESAGELLQRQFAKQPAWCQPTATRDRSRFVRQQFTEQSTAQHGPNDGGQLVPAARTGSASPFRRIAATGRRRTAQRLRRGWAQWWICRWLWPRTALTRTNFANEELNRLST